MSRMGGFNIFNWLLLLGAFEVGTFSAVHFIFTVVESVSQSVREMVTYRVCYASKNTKLLSDLL